MPRTTLNPLPNRRDLRFTPHQNQLRFGAQTCVDAPLAGARRPQVKKYKAEQHGKVAAAAIRMYERALGAHSPVAVRPEHAWGFDA